MGDEQQEEEEERNYEDDVGVYEGDGIEVGIERWGINLPV